MLACHLDTLMMIYSFNRTLTNVLDKAIEITMALPNTDLQQYTNLSYSTIQGFKKRCESLSREEIEKTTAKKTLAALANLYDSFVAALNNTLDDETSNK